MSFIQNNNKYPDEQLGYIRRASQILASRGGGKACVITYGCQQNVSDSERIKGMLAEIGYTLTENTAEADFILFNTCAVRGHAEDRVYGNVGATKRLKAAKPSLIVAVCGCMAQQESVAERFKKSYPYVDIVFGTQVQHRLPEFIYRRMSGGPRIFELSLENADIIEGVPIRRDGKFKGFLPVMYGCNNFCTYCIVPYVRGRERSRSADEVVSEARAMVAAGYKEIMLLGQNVNSYGKSNDEGVSFAELLRRINAIEGDFRIRFMTSHPKDCTMELLDAMRDCEKVERHLHLPVQSGSDRILKMMNRRYTSADYLRLVEAARERMPDIKLTSDIIVGFPQETYEDFLATAELVRQVRYTALFTFIYSPREGTPAAAMPDPVAREEKGRWFAELLRVQEQIAEELTRESIGKTECVLCEEEQDGLLSGKTSGGLSVSFEGGAELVGQFVNVEIKGYDKSFYGIIKK